MPAEMPEARRQVSWADLVTAEPALAKLESDIRRVKAKRGAGFCANGAWYGYAGWPGFKARLQRLVGWHAQNPNLRTMGAYDLAYEYLYHLLPDCRDCGCL